MTKDHAGQTNPADAAIPSKKNLRLWKQKHIPFEYQCVKLNEIKKDMNRRLAEIIASRPGADSTPVRIFAPTRSAAARHEKRKTRS
jgi:hypothetical protein